jgi:hypothetical protein
MPSFFGRMFAKYLSRAAALPLLSSTHCTDFNRATILKSSMESSSTAVRNTRDNSGSAQQPINDNSVPTAIADGNTKIKSRSIFKRVKNRLSKIRNGLGKSRKKPAEQTDTLPSPSPSPAFKMGRPRSIQERESERESERRLPRQSERRSSLQSLRQSERRSSRDRSRSPSITSTAADRSQKEERRLSSVTPVVTPVINSVSTPPVTSAVDSLDRCRQRPEGGTTIVIPVNYSQPERTIHGGEIRPW